MSMFINYTSNNSSSTASSSATTAAYLTPKMPDKPFQDINAAGVLVGYYWYYGSTLTLSFTITGEVLEDGEDAYITAEEYFQDATYSSKNVIFKIYDFRHNPIYSITFENVSSNIIEIPIDAELSNSLERGVYFCSLELIDNLYPNTITLFDESYCTLTVR